MSWASPDGLVMHALQPVLAEGLRRSAAGAGTEWGASLQRVLDDPRAVASFQSGFREGVFEGGKSLVEGAWGLVKGAAGVAYNTNPVGWAVDGLKHLGVVQDVPDWVPDASRVTDQATAAGKAIGDYVGAVAHDPAKLGNDIKGWIGANWDSLKADHAAAAAKGGAVEAEWWGKIAGRATFEIAAVAVPVTKFATVAKAGEALSLAVKTGRLGETFAEAARAGKLGELAAAAGKAGTTAELVNEARAAGRLPELVAAARSTTGGIETLAARGGVTVDEINAFEKAGTLSKVEAQAARIAEVEARRGPEIAATAARTGVPETKIADILATPKPDRPLPASYLSADRVAAGLAKFDDGAIRVTSRSAVTKYGTLGPRGGFVMPAREFEGLVKAANGDLRVVEQKLGLDTGTLANSDTLIAYIERDDLPNLRLPSGNETGANAQWLPGGTTSGGQSEAVVDFAKGVPYRELTLGGGK